MQLVPGRRASAASTMKQYTFGTTNHMGCVSNYNLVYLALSTYGPFKSVVDNQKICYTSASKNTHKSEALAWQSKCETMKNSLSPAASVEMSTHSMS